MDFANRNIENILNADRSQQRRPGEQVEGQAFLLFLNWTLRYSGEKFFMFLLLFTHVYLHSNIFLWGGGHGKSNVNLYLNLPCVSVCPAEPIEPKFCVGPCVIPGKV